MNMTTKQIISLLLMTAAMAVILSLLPEHPTDSARSRPAAQLTLE